MSNFKDLSLPMQKMVIDFYHELRNSLPSLYMKLIVSKVFDEYFDNIFKSEELLYNGRKVVFLPENEHEFDQAIKANGYEIKREMNPILGRYTFFQLHSENERKIHKYTGKYGLLGTEYRILLNLNLKPYNESCTYERLLEFLRRVSLTFETLDVKKNMNDAKYAEFITDVVESLLPYKILGSCLIEYITGMDSPVPYYVDGPAMFLYHKLVRFINESKTMHTDNLSMFELKAALCDKFGLSNAKSSPSSTVDDIMEIFEIYMDAKEISTNGILSVRDYLLSDYTIRESADYLSINQYIKTNEPLLVDDIEIHDDVKKARKITKEMVGIYAETSNVSFHIPTVLKSNLYTSFQGEFKVYSTLDENMDERLLLIDNNHQVFLCFMDSSSLKAVSLKMNENGERNVINFFDLDPNNHYQIVSKENLPYFPSCK